MRKSMIFVMLLVSLFFTTNSFAAFSFGIEQASPDTFNITFTTDADAVFGVYGLSFVFDDSEMSFLEYTANPLPGLTSMGGISEINPGVLSDLSAYSMSNVTVGIGTYIIGTLRFTIPTLFTQDGVVDLGFNSTDASFMFQVDGATYAHATGNLGPVLTPAFIDVGSPIPVPSSFLLLGGGLCALLGISRKK